jgi:hypothetical protein
MKSKIRENLLSNVLTVLFASLIAFLAVPVYMMAQSTEDFDFIVLSTFLNSGLLLAILLFLILGLVLALLHFFRLHKAASHFSMFVISWIVLAGFILPLSISTGMVEPENNPIDKLNFVIVLILAVSVMMFAARSSKKASLWFLAIVVAGSMIPSLLTVYKDLDLVDVPENIATRKIYRDVLSNKKNILVVSFDGMPGRVIADLFKNDPGLSEIFKDFTFFENALSQAPVTRLSLMGEIYGVRDYKSIGKDHAGVFRGLQHQGLNQQLLTSKVADSYQYGYSFIETKRLPLTSTSGFYRKQLETIAFFRYLFVRIGTRFTLTLLPWEIVPNLFSPYLNFSEFDSNLIRLNQHNGKNWDIKNILKIQEYNSWVEGLSAGDKEFSIRYLHFTFTHFPVDFDASCNYRSDDVAWYRRNQTEIGVRSQSICALSLLSEFISKLKFLGVYDNSMIVLKSDHGEPPFFYSDEPDNLQLNGHKHFGYNRYRPTLMIKNFKTNNHNITFNKDLVLLNDMAKTLCVNSGLDVRCELFPGMNLLAADLNSNDPYFIYVVKNAKSSVKFETYISVKIPSRNMDFLEALRESPQVSLSPVD